MAKKESVEITVIIGAGGTGSDFIRLGVQYFNVGDKKTKQKISIVDRDVVEEKNLLRQKFLKGDLNQYKAGTLAKRFQPILNDHVELEAKNVYINSVNDVFDYLNLDEVFKESKVEKVRILSCVDNNMARLRMLLAMYCIHDKYDVTVEFADSGNELWNGQTIGSIIYKGEETLFKGLYKAVTEKGIEGVKEFKLGKNGRKNVLWSIFVQNDNWISKLTKADYELSCDDVTVSSPQNIATNMQASVMLLKMVSEMDSGKFNGGYYSFNAKQNSYKVFNEGQQVEDGYEARMATVLEYLKTETGFAEVFSDDVLIGLTTDDVQEELSKM